MDNPKLIACLKYCGDKEEKQCCFCPAADICRSTVAGHYLILRSAADALEAAEKRIEELEADKKTLINVVKDKSDFHRTKDAMRIMKLESMAPKRGEWVWLSSTYDRAPCEMRYWCSVCHHEEITHNGDKPWHNYCPNCGARMRKGAK